MSPQGKTAVFQSRRLEAGETLKLEVMPDNPRDAAFLSALRSATDDLGIVSGLNAWLARVRIVSQAREGSQEVWTMELLPKDIGAGSMEMAFASISADQLAEMRARRILLDEKLSESMDRINALTLESFVRGLNTTIKVPHSPFPAIYEELKNDIPRFLAVARLRAILWLRLSEVVEHVFQLDLQMDGNDRLAVKFEGERRKVYSNVEPTIIQVQGTCNLVK